MCSSNMCRLMQVCGIVNLREYNSMLLGTYLRIYYILKLSLSIVYDATTKIWMVWKSFGGDFIEEPERTIMVTFRLLRSVK